MHMEPECATLFSCLKEIKDLKQEESLKQDDRKKLFPSTRWLKTSSLERFICCRGPGACFSLTLWNQKIDSWNQLSLLHSCSAEGDVCRLCCALWVRRILSIGGLEWDLTTWTFNKLIVEYVLGMSLLKSAYIDSPYQTYQVFIKLMLYIETYPVASHCRLSVDAGDTVIHI